MSVLLEPLPLITNEAVDLMMLDRSEISKISKTSEISDTRKEFKGFLNKQALNSNSKLCSVIVRWQKEILKARSTKFTQFAVMPQSVDSVKINWLLPFSSFDLCTEQILRHHLSENLPDKSLDSSSSQRNQLVQLPQPSPPGQLSFSVILHEEKANQLNISIQEVKISQVVDGQTQEFLTSSLIGKVLDSCVKSALKQYEQQKRELQKQQTENLVLQQQEFLKALAAIDRGGHLLRKRKHDFGDASDVNNSSKLNASNSQNEQAKQVKLNDGSAAVAAPTVVVTAPVPTSVASTAPLTASAAGINSQANNMSTNTESTITGQGKRWTQTLIKINSRGPINLVAVILDQFYKLLHNYGSGCCMCGQYFPHCTLWQPTICTKKTCRNEFLDKHGDQYLWVQIQTNPSVVDLFVSWFMAALNYSGIGLVLPTKHLVKPFHLAFNHQVFKLYRKLLWEKIHNGLPAIKGLQSLCKTVGCLANHLNSIDPDLLQILKWLVVKYHTVQIKQVPISIANQGAGCSHQFQVNYINLEQYSNGFLKKAQACTLTPSTVSTAASTEKMSFDTIGNIDNNANIDAFIDRHCHYGFHATAIFNFHSLMHSSFRVRGDSGLGNSGASIWYADCLRYSLDGYLTRATSTETRNIDNWLAHTPVETNPFGNGVSTTWKLSEFGNHIQMCAIVQALNTSQFFAANIPFAGMNRLPRYSTFQEFDVESMRIVGLLMYSKRHEPYLAGMTFASDLLKNQVQPL